MLSCFLIPTVSHVASAQEAIDSVVVKKEFSGTTQMETNSYTLGDVELFSNYDNNYGLIRDVLIDGDIAYVCGDGGGLQILNVSDPENPIRLAEHMAYINCLDVSKKDDIIPTRFAIRQTKRTSRVGWATKLHMRQSYNFVIVKEQSDCGNLSF